MSVLYWLAKMSRIEENLKEIESRIRKAKDTSGRTEDQIKLVAVTKTVEPARIKEAIKLGVRIIGENRVQEAEEKLKDIAEKVEKHLVGHLQTNKVKKTIELFDMIQSVDSFHLAEEVSKRALEKGKSMDVLVEVNTSGEKTKFGVEPEQTANLVESISKLEGIRVKGLMTVGLFSDDPEATRPCFKKLKSLFDEIKSTHIPNVEMRYLSMGMTSDFEVAIEEGSNMVRIGTGIFGPR
jgi:pyridoxal phosphate enzyme (YggS family)